MKKDSFILYNSFYEPLKELSLEEKGQILDAVFLYHIEGMDPELPPVLKMAFVFMKNQFDRDLQKYQAICERNRKNGKKGGRPGDEPSEPKKPSGLTGNPKNPDEPKKPDNDNDNDTDNDNSFVQFWDLYDKKVGKKNALSQWNKLSKSDKQLIFSHIPKYVEANPNKQYRKDPERYLKNRVWEDEIISTQEINGKKQSDLKPAGGMQR